jgi:hypothetical protein
MSRKYNDDFINNLCDCYDNERDDNGDCPCKKKLKWLLILLLLLFSFFGYNYISGDNISKEEQYERDTKEARLILEKNLINLNITDRRTAIELLNKTNKSGGIGNVPVKLVQKDRGFYFVKKNIYDDSVNRIGSFSDISVVDNNNSNDYYNEDKGIGLPKKTEVIDPDFNDYNTYNGSTDDKLETNIPIEDNYIPLEGGDGEYAMPYVPPYIPSDNNTDNNNENTDKVYPNTNGSNSNNIYKGYREVNFSNQSVICKNFINGGCVSNTKNVKTYVSNYVNVVNSAYSPSFMAAHIDSVGDGKEDFVLVVHPSYVNATGMLIEINGRTTSLSSKDFYELSSSNYNLVGAY